MPKLIEPKLIEAHGLTKVYKYGKRSLSALQDVSLSIEKGKTLGVVGESGCGKSTLGRLLLQLERATSGSVLFQGKETLNASPLHRQQLRRQMQIIFQDPYSSLNPRMTVEDCIAEGIDIHKIAKGAQRREIVVDLLKSVGLETSILRRYPSEFSGGQRQRIVIARALAVDPSFVVCDEPLSALDACTHQQVMELLLRFKVDKQLTYLFISHDLNAVRAIADDVAVMYLGKIVEYAPANQIFEKPAHPYTQALLSAIPIADPKLERVRPRFLLKGEPPSPLDPPQGCPFHTRCPIAMPQCKTVVPLLQEHRPGHFSACHASFHH